MGKNNKGSKNLPSKFLHFTGLKRIDEAIHVFLYYVLENFIDTSRTPGTIEKTMQYSDTSTH